MPPPKVKRVALPSTDETREIVEMRAELPRSTVYRDDDELVRRRMFDEATPVIARKRAALAADRRVGWALVDMSESRWVASGVTAIFHRRRGSAAHLAEFDLGPADVAAPTGIPHVELRVPIDSGAYVVTCQMRALSPGPLRVEVRIAGTQSGQPSRTTDLPQSGKLDIWLPATFSPADHLPAGSLATIQVWVTGAGAGWAFEGCSVYKQGTSSGDGRGPTDVTGL